VVIHDIIPNLFSAIGDWFLFGEFYRGFFTINMPETTVDNAVLEPQVLGSVKPHRLSGGAPVITRALRLTKCFNSTAGVVM
jgi:hypothetical protein